MKTRDQKPTSRPDRIGDSTQPNREPGQDAAKAKPDDIQGPHTTIPAKEDVKAPWHAAKGNDEVMSQKQKQP